MSARIHRFVRDLHLYSGLFIGPFVLVFSASVFFLVHAWLPKPGEPPKTRVVAYLPLPSNLNDLSGRARIDALRPALDKAGVHGEVGWIQHRPRDNQLIIPVSVPGRLTTVTIDLVRREASIEQRTTGLADALVVLHKSPGPHLVDLRMNWLPMAIWRVFADATVYLVLLITVTGIWLWYGSRTGRKTGAVFLVLGVVSFLGLVYALVF